jgi:anthranilate/para-aminobenzoate synthase component I
MAEMDSMESVIDRVIGENGYAAVYSYIMERMKSDFDFMSGIFGKEQVEIEVRPPVKEKKPVKKKVQPVAEAVAEGGAEVVRAQNTIGNVPVVVAPVVVAPVTVSQEEKKEEDGAVLPLEGDAPEEKLSTKQRQKIQQDKTRARLDKEGKTVEMMLTVEKMKEWLAAGDSFAVIASERIGCQQKLVSDFAKTHGLKSVFVDQRGAMIGRKKAAGG